MRRMVTSWAVVAIMSLGLVGMQALGQDSTDQPPVSDAVVGHLSAINGSVSVQRGDTGDWQAGALNQPLLTGDNVATSEGGRAEVQLDYADLLRLDSNSQANLAALTNNDIQVQVAAGVVDFVVLHNAHANIEIDTPNIAIHPRGPGVYRIEIPTDAESQVIVRSGSADITTPQGSVNLGVGQLITVEGTSSPQYKISDAPPVDGWDQWNSERDRSFRDARSLQYTNPYYAGVQVLDGYGDWSIVAGYGRVWIPNTAAGWTPYSDGRWVWEPGWGWTWVDYEPWGWAPFHYGRWFPYHDRWAWWPGPVTPFYQPMWAPAYVSFMGWGNGFGFGVGIGFGPSIGWVPIGPCDPYRPWWGGRGFNRINITNVTVINNYRERGVIAPLAYAGPGRRRYSNLDSLTTNAMVRRAVIRVPVNEFGHGGVRARAHVTASELRRGAVVGGELPVVPSRQSVQLTHPVSRSVAAPRNAATHFFGRRGTVIQRPSFTAERARIESRIRANPAARAAAPRNTSRVPLSRAPINRAPISRAPNAAPYGGNRAPAARNPATRSIRPAQPRTAAPRTAAPRNAAPRPAAPRSAAPRPAEPRSSLGAGWQRFGGGTAARSAAAPRGQMAARPAPSAPANATRPGWNRFGGSAPGGGVYRSGAQGNQSTRSFGGGSNSPAYRAPRTTSRYGGAYRPPLQVGHPIVQAPRPSAPARSQAPHMNAPSMRTAPQPRANYGGGMGGYGGGSPHYGGAMRSAPQVYAPPMRSAPQPRASYGGGMRSSGGGAHNYGGGMRSAPQASYGGGGGHSYSAPRTGGGGHVIRR